MKGPCNELSFAVNKIVYFLFALRWPLLYIITWKNLSSLAWYFFSKMAAKMIVRK